MKHSLRPFLTLLTAGLVLSLTVSCGKKNKKDDDEDGSTPIALVGAEAIVGEWSGIYNSLDDAGKVLGLSDATDVEFKEDGDFQLRLKENMNAQVKGLWSEFGGKSLMLTVKESTISKIQVSNSIQEVTYELRGNSLYVKGSTFELKITKKQTTSSPNQPPENNPFTGNWLCTKSGIETQVAINAELNWKAIISQDNRRTVNLEGSGQIGDGGRLNMKINSSSEPVPSENALYMVRNGLVASIYTFTRDGNDLLGECKKN